MSRPAQIVEKQISFSALDWVVTRKEQQQAVDALDGSSDLSGEIMQLDRDGMLEPLLHRVGEPDLRARLIQILAGRLAPAVKLRVRPLLDRWCFGGAMEHSAYFTWSQLFDICDTLQRQSFGNRGLPSGTCSRTPTVSISLSPADPLTGSGGSGRSVDSAPAIPTADRFRLLFGTRGAMNRYKGPTYSDRLTTFLNGLSPHQLLANTANLLNLCINTRFGTSYSRGLPSRAIVMRAAARRYQLDPALVGAIILVEQWDQSRNEDSADYQGAMSIIGKNTSIGLGQVVISTAKQKNLFSDLLPPSLLSSLTHRQIATLLTCDEFNIFAVAKFLRQSANAGALKDPRSPGILDTVAAFPNINMKAYAQHSSTWPMDNIAALASEYTSNQWDGLFVFDWSDLMRIAYQNIKLGRLL